MTRRMTVTLDDEQYRWMLGCILMLQSVQGRIIPTVTEEMGEVQVASQAETPVQAARSVGGDAPEAILIQSDRSRVQHRAVAEQKPEIMAELGEKTIIGLIFSHLVSKGPKTARQIRLELPIKVSTIDSSLQKLGVLGLVQSEPIPSVTA